MWKYSSTCVQGIKSQTWFKTRYGIAWRLALVRGLIQKWSTRLWWNSGTWFLDNDNCFLFSRVITRFKNISSMWPLAKSNPIFYSQGKAQWIARFASIRLQSRAPWEQKRTIIGMVKSPVEGNSVVLLKMDEPLVFSDFARPICIPDKDDFVDQDSKCVTLGMQS